jgi:hypothetical protein
MNDKITTSSHRSLIGAGSMITSELRTDVDHHFAQVEAKLDSKPGLMAMFTSIAVATFSTTSIITSTIASLHSLGLLKSG